MIARARQAAYSVLQDVEMKGKYSNVALQQSFRKVRMDDRDKALCTEIVYGTLQAQRSLDTVIGPMCHRGLEALDKRVLVLLRMAIYQLAFLSRVPSYAVLDDTVELCKRTSPKASGFVNGVLRAYTRDSRSFMERLETLCSRVDTADRLGILYSYPSWLVERLVHDFGPERTERMLEACNERSTLSVRVNQTKATRDEVWDMLPAEFRENARLSEISPAGIRLSRGIDVENWDLYRDGFVTVQDEASMLIAPLTQVQRNSRIVDMCAGMGTKTTQILECMACSGAKGEAGSEEPGRVDAVDIHQHKLQALKAALVRLGLNGCKTVLADARSLASRATMREKFDAVLLDAPCSGTGVLRRRPEIRWRRTENDASELSALQRELLKTAIALVRPGGVVVYATCSVLEEENRAVVLDVVREFDGAVSFDSLEDDVSANVWGACKEDQTMGISVTPEQFSTDGFYMVRLRKLK